MNVKELGRLALATEEELKSMTRGEKYSRYLYDLETVYGDMIALLNTVNPEGKVWEVQQTGGMCCILSVHIEGELGNIQGAFEFAVCPEGNLHIDDDVWNQSYLVGWSFYSEDGDSYDEGECLYDVSPSELVTTVVGLMNEKGLRSI